ncbi:hypothetical protein M569_14682, partial [Genlisea aurea]
ALVLFIELSAEMYEAGIPGNVESWILFAAAEVVWLYCSTELEWDSLSPASSASSAPLPKFP